MIQINPYIKKVVETTCQLGLRKANQWLGFTINMISLIPAQMQNHPHVAIGVIASTNLLFLAVVGSAIAHMDRRLENQKEPLSADQRLMKNILLNGVVLGGSALAFNSLIFKNTQYRLTPSTLASIFMVMILGRIIFSKLSNFFKKNTANVEKKVVFETHRPIISNRLEQTKNIQEKEDFLHNPRELEIPKKEQEEQEKIEKDSHKLETHQLETEKKDPESEIPQKPSRPKSSECENGEKNILVKIKEEETEIFKVTNLPKPLKIYFSQLISHLFNPPTNHKHPLALIAKPLVRKKSKQKKFFNVENFILKYVPKNKRRAILCKNKGYRRFSKSALKRNLYLNHAQPKNVNLLYQYSRFKTRATISSFQQKNDHSLSTSFWPKVKPIVKPFQPKIHPFFIPSFPKAKNKGLLPQTKNMHSILTSFWPKAVATVAKPSPFCLKAEISAEKPYSQKPAEWDSFEYFAFI